MKRVLARLLLTHLARMGLVLFTADLANADPSATAQNTAGDAANPGQSEATRHEDDDNANPAGSGDVAHNDHDKTIRKLQRRIDTRSRALGERDATIAALREQLARASTATRDDDDHTERPAASREPAEDIESRARELARDTLVREKIADKTRAMLDKGKAFEGFRELALDVAADLPFVDAKGRPTPFIEAVLDADTPEASAAILAHLGRNPDLVADLAGMSHSQMVRRIAKLETELAKKPPQRSNAAKPLEPVHGRGDTSRDSAALSDAEWRAQRLKQRQKATA